MIAQIGVNDAGIGALVVVCAVVAGTILFVIILGSVVLNIILLRAGEFDSDSNEPGDATEKPAPDAQVPTSGGR